MFSGKVLLNFEGQPRPLLDSLRFPPLDCLMKKLSHRFYIRLRGELSKLLLHPYCWCSACENDTSFFFILKGNYYSRQGSR